MVDFPNAIDSGPDELPAPDGIALTMADTGADGIRVMVINGEAFGPHIEWDRSEGDEKLVTISKDPKTGQPMLSYPFGTSGLRAEYRGLESDGITWWRYAHEVDPREYREHCLRVVRKA